MSGTSSASDRTRARFEGYILRDRGIAFLQRNDPSVDAEHDYADPFIQEAWEAWQGALSDLPSASPTVASTQQLRNTLQDVALWLKSALNCKRWEWDSDQRLAAMGCLEEAEALLESPSETAANQITDLNINVNDAQGLRAEATFKGEAIKQFAASALQWFRDSGGEAFVTVDLTDPDSLERYSITMQRAFGKTPAQELSELRAALKTATTAEVDGNCSASP